ncbi:molybdopterin oxidoreductase family protein [Patulibacter defluvii]|uniref:molybdopterin oxidoreductase family protein n=1 Tax=Patulibacter defluvii TaxID=3095358 RepID=UPI002A7526C9|nr:molybdopterin-dependent oxidoreductase [Patulibacter sp. DM4]
MRERIEDPWGPVTPIARGAPWPARVDLQLADGLTEADVERWTPAASLLHSNGDAMEVAVRDGRIVGVRGRADDRVNRGRLGPKDLFGWQANAAPDRLTRPLVRRGGRLQPTDWDDALATIVDRCQAILGEQGPGGIGFYTSGQLFAEEYWTLTTIARAGIGTPHLDGNTRLCTATAGESLKESFGCDGQPGSYDDVLDCDALALWGHNVAETQPVLWMRMRDRLAGPDRPRLLVVDPRRTLPAQAADVHLAVRSGTNLPLLLALVRRLLDRGWIDDRYVAAHTIGLEQLDRSTIGWSPARAAAICGVDAGAIEAAAELLGTCEALTSTVLQGLYQSHQATASACQVNNIHLLRGMLGRPGCGVLQMNGQPTAENTRETGANGDLPGFRNWANPGHVAELAEIWNVEPERIPHDGPPTHAMEIFRLCEQGEIWLLWISATNPAVSLPEAARIRRILGDPRLLVVAQDIFPTETTALADVVLPGATWGEKTGVFTNADRTVHLSERAVAPPGEARSDLEIFLAFARALDLRDRDGAPLIDWTTPEQAYRAWQRCSAGRPCDYSAIGYDDLRARGGIQWGGERLYADGRFRAAPDDAESYGRDLLNGESFGADGYRALNPEGRAMLRSCPVVPLPEPPDAAHPLLLTTGRTVHHFHTRTKTGRVPELRDAAPDVWVELAPEDAEPLGIGEGDRVELRNARGRVEAPARITGSRPGVVFLPFHYGWWDLAEDDARRHHRAANELTATRWDPVSKQPTFKVAAVAVRRLAAAPVAAGAGAATGGR